MLVSSLFASGQVLFDFFEKGVESRRAWFRNRHSRLGALSRGPLAWHGREGNDECDAASYQFSTGAWRSNHPIRHSHVHQDDVGHRGGSQSQALSAFSAVITW